MAGTHLIAEADLGARGGIEKVPEGLFGAGQNDEKAEHQHQGGRRQQQGDGQHLTQGPALEAQFGVLAVKAEEDQADGDQRHLHHQIEKIAEFEGKQRGTGQGENRQDEELQIVAPAAFGDQPQAKEQDEDVDRRFDQTDAADLGEIVGENGQGCQGRRYRRQNEAGPPTAQQSGEQGEGKEEARPAVEKGIEGGDPGQADQCREDIEKGANPDHGSPGRPAGADDGRGSSPAAAAFRRDAGPPGARRGHSD